MGIEVLGMSLSGARMWDMYKAIFGEMGKRQVGFSSGVCGNQPYRWEQEAWWKLPTLP